MYFSTRIDLRKIIQFSITFEVILTLCILFNVKRLSFFSSESQLQNGYDLSSETNPKIILGENKADIFWAVLTLIFMPSLYIICQVLPTLILFTPLMPSKYEASMFALFNACLNINGDWGGAFINSNLNDTF